MSCGRSLAWLFGVEMAPGTMQHKVARKQEADTSPRISVLFSFFYFAFHVLDLDGFSSGNSLNSLCRQGK